MSTAGGTAGTAGSKAHSPTPEPDPAASDAIAGRSPNVSPIGSERNGPEPAESRFYRQPDKQSVASTGQDSYIKPNRGILKKGALKNQEAHDAGVPKKIAIPKQDSKAELRSLRDKLGKLRERFADVSDSLKCGVCGNIFLDPVQIVHPDCNHIFCERCLELRSVEDPICPECGFRFGPALVRRATAIDNIILDQLVPCYYEPAGCQEQIRFRGLDEHERRCQWNPDRLIECVCGAEMPISRHQQHLATDCPQYSFDCPYGCGFKVKRKNLQTHEDVECPMKPARCDFAIFGCKHKGPRAELGKHNKTNFEQHMAMMAGRIQNLEAETTKMHREQRERDWGLPADRKAAALKRAQQPGHQGGGGNSSDTPLGAAKAAFGQSTGDFLTKTAGALDHDPIDPNYHPDLMEGGISDRVIPAGMLSRTDDLSKPKWGRLSLPRRVIDSPPNASYKFVRPFGVAFLDNNVIVMADCRTVFMIDIETGAVRSQLEPMTDRLKSLYRPRGICVQEGLRVLVADSQADCVHSFTPQGEFNMSFGSDVMKYPMGLTCLRNRIYVCDSNHHTMQIFDSSTGKHVGRLFDEFHGSPLQAASSETSGLIYATMNSTKDSYVLVHDHNGEFVTTFGKKGDDIGLLSSARGVVVDQNQNVYVSNANPYKIQVFAKFPSKVNLRDLQKWEDKMREDVFREEYDRQMEKSGGSKGILRNSLGLEDRVQQRLKQKQEEMPLPPFEYRIVDWLGGEPTAPHGMAISPNCKMLAVVDEIRNKVYIY